MQYPLPLVLHPTHSEIQFLIPPEATLLSLQQERPTSELCAFGAVHRAEILAGPQEQNRPIQTRHWRVQKAIRPRRPGAHF
jgi:hypothetical protein